MLDQARTLRPISVEIVPKPQVAVAAAVNGADDVLRQSLFCGPGVDPILGGRGCRMQPHDREHDRGARDAARSWAPTVDG